MFTISSYIRGTIFVILPMLKALGLIYLFTIGCFSITYSQQCDKVLFTGKVTDTLRPQSFYNLMVINRTTGRGVFGQPNGSFSVYVSNGDSVALSVRGYPVINLVIEANSDCQHNNSFYVENKVQEISEVVVRPLKTLEEIKEERQALAMRETRMVTGIEVLRSPITALYQALSQKERSKRWVAEHEHADNQRGILKELLRTYVAYKIIEMSEERFDEFISFLNMDETFLKTASEMELITFIQDKYEHFIWLHKLK